MTRIFAGCLGSCIFCVAACGSPTSTPGGHPPTVRIAASPAYIPINDGYLTPISLDGSSSHDDLDDPNAEKHLRYQWTLDVDDPQSPFLPSSTDPQVTLHLAGTHPVTVRLTVADYDDDQGTTTTLIGVTVP
jgi:hypothetical protein